MFEWTPRSNGSLLNIWPNSNHLTLSCRKNYIIIQLNLSYFLKFSIIKKNYRFFISITFSPIYEYYHFSSFRYTLNFPKFTSKITKFISNFFQLLIFELKLCYSSFFLNLIPSSLKDRRISSLYFLFSFQ